MGNPAGHEDAPEPGPADPAGRLLADLERWMADAKVDDAARARSREGWLRRQAEEEATLNGALADLAEHTTAVTVTTTSGRHHPGRIVAVGQDFCVLRTSGGTLILIPAAAVSSVRVPPDRQRTEATGSRPAPVDATLHGVLAGLAGDRRRVLVALHGNAEVLSGELRSVGIDVLTLRLDGEPATTVYLRSASVSEVSLFGSG